MPNALVAAAATGLPSACTALATIRDCELVYAALQGALDTVTNVMLRPICQQGTRAYDRLEALSDTLMAEADLVIGQAQAMCPQTRFQADERAQLLLQHEIYCGSSAENIAAKAATLAAERSRLPQAHH